MTQFITEDSTYFYRASTGRSRELVLIWGDEVEETGAEANGRTEVTYRVGPAGSHHIDLATSR